jgi:hypothetical protein
LATWIDAYEDANTAQNAKKEGAFFFVAIPLCIATGINLFWLFDGGADVMFVRGEAIMSTTIFLILAIPKIFAIPSMIAAGFRWPLVHFTLTHPRPSQSS